MQSARAPSHTYSTRHVPPGRAGSRTWEVPREHAVTHAAQHGRGKSWGNDTEREASIHRRKKMAPDSGSFPPSLRSGNNSLDQKHGVSMVPIPMFSPLANTHETDYPVCRFGISTKICKCKRKGRRRRRLKPCQPMRLVY